MDDSTGRNGNDGSARINRIGMIIVLIAALVIAAVCIGFYVLLSCWGPDHAVC